MMGLDAKRQAAKAQMQGQAAKDETPLVFTDTDLANGKKFVADHGASVCYVADWKLWTVFDGKRWVPDKSETLVQKLAKETTVRMAEEAVTAIANAAKLVAETTDEEGKLHAEKKLTAARRDLAHAKRSQDMRAVKRMLEAARSETQVCVQRGRDRFDVLHYLLNVQNGTVDLRTGAIRPHLREDFLTRLSPVAFDPKARRDGYLKFLNRVFHGKPDVAAYVRKFSGYVATGETCDHSFHVFFGDGSNGKSVLLNLWTWVLGKGEYEHTAAPELLVNNGQTRHPTERVGLRGARLVVCQESREDGRLDEAMVKALTSGDLITARGMGQDFYDFTPSHKLVLSTNHKPKLRGSDHGIRRRIRLIPFAVKFWREADRAMTPEVEFNPEFKADPGLEDRLKANEAAGILADMVEHAKAFYDAGSMLDPPSEITAATVEYFKGENLVEQFFDAMVVDDPDCNVRAADFFLAFKKWATGEGHDEKKLPGVRRFGLDATTRFKKVTIHGSTVYKVHIADFMGSEPLPD